MKKVLKKIAATLMAASMIISCVPATATFAAEQTVTGKFTAASMNVDGLPAKILGLISINPDGPGSDGTKLISQKIATKGWDIFSVSEDFNYNTELMSSLNTSYNSGTYRGGITGVSNDTDGLNFIWKKNISVSGEKYVGWTEKYSSGIFGSGNGADGMIDKGYRFYQATFAEGVTVDFYILHMDADSDAEDIAAREAELKQMVDAIKASNNHNPIIVMGDTNCRYTREHLQTGFIDEINKDSRFTIQDGWIEKCKNGVYPTYGSASLMVGDLGYVEGEIVDKMFYINNTDSDVTLTLDNFKVDTDFNKADGTPLADHYPVVGDFTYTLKKDVPHEHDYKVTDTKNATCTEKGQKTLACECGDSCIVEFDTALGHNYEGVVTKQPTETATGIRTYTCNRCNDSYTEIIPKLTHTHNYTKTVTPATCTAKGYTTYTCSCGDSYKADETDMIAHSYKNGVCTVCDSKDPDYQEPSGDKNLGEEVQYGKTSDGEYCIAFIGTEKKALSSNGSTVTFTDFNLGTGSEVSDNLIWTVKKQGDVYTISTKVDGKDMYLAKTTTFNGVGYKVKLQTQAFTWIFGTNGTSGGIRVSWLNSSKKNYYLRYYNSKLGFIGTTNCAGLHFFKVK